MINFVVGLMCGSCFGICLSCLLQANNDDKNKRL